MVVNTRVGVIYKLASWNFGRIESACRYLLYFHQENVEKYCQDFFVKCYLLDTTKYAKGF